MHPRSSTSTSSRLRFCKHRGRADGVSCGFPSSFTTTPLADAAGLYLEDLFVKPEFRAGIGRALSQAANRVARGCGRMEWSVLSGTSPHRLLPKLGAGRWRSGRSTGWTAAPSTPRLGRPSGPCGAGGAFRVMKAPAGRRIQMRRNDDETLALRITRRPPGRTTAASGVVPRKPIPSLPQLARPDRLFDEEGRLLSVNEARHRRGRRIAAGGPPSTAPPLWSDPSAVRLLEAAPGPRGSNIEVVVPAAASSGPHLLGFGPALSGAARGVRRGGSEVTEKVSSRRLKSSTNELRTHEPRRLIRIPQPTTPFILDPKSGGR